MTDPLAVGGKVPLERYRQLMEDAPVVTVDVLLLDEAKRKILLGRRVNEPYAGEFFSFGSRMYKNEDFETAAIRIVNEEVGLNILKDDLQFIGVLNEINEVSIFEGVNYHAVDIYFYCVIGKDTIALDAQHSEAQWFDVDDDSIHPRVQNRIKSMRKVAGQ